MKNQKLAYDRPVCELCGDHEHAEVVCAAKSTYSDPVYVEEVYWCLCDECLENLYLE